MTEIEKEENERNPYKDLDPYTDIELGERHLKVSDNHIVDYTIFATKDAKIYYIYYFFVIQGRASERRRIIKKETAIYMLSRLPEINECEIRKLISNFDEERLRIQLFDRLNDPEKFLSDKEIQKQLNKVRTFAFFGKQSSCGRGFPHIPHVIGEYEGLFGGTLQIFCIGVPGTLLLKNGKEVQIVITSDKNCSKGCAGRYVILELE